MDLKRLSNYKTMIILFSVIVVVNLVVLAFVWRLDGFVHGDLYSYGLVFSPNWANEWSDYSWMVIVFLSGANVLAALSMLPLYLRQKEDNRFSKYAGFFLPLTALVYQALATVNLNQINNLVWNRLYAYGVQYSIDWSATYNPISLPALALMVVALFALIITVIVSLKIEIKIVYEDEDESFTVEDREKAAEPQETVKPPAKEEGADLTTSIQLPMKQADSTGKPSAEVSLEDRTVKKGRKQKRGERKRRRKSRSAAHSRG